MIMQNPVMPFLVSGCVFLFALSGCSKKSKDAAGGNALLPAVTTAVVTHVDFTAATCGGTVSSDGGASVTRRGVCWSKSSDPVVAGAHTVDGSGTGTFESQISGLDTNTLYYVRAYASNSEGTAYGNTELFQTLKLIIYGPVTDIDGNKYPVIRIGDKLWLQKNLRVKRYRNGDAIPEIPADAQWKTLTSGAFCYYDNQESADSVYGKLYNWHTVTDSRGLCPAGWHVAGNEDWEAMGTVLGGNSVAGGKMKLTGTIEGGSGLWYAPNADATNASGFTGLPGGYRINYGTYYSLGNVGYFWSATDTASVNAWNYILDANNGELKRNYNLKTNGFSIRCCKD